MSKKSKIGSAIYWFFLVVYTLVLCAVAALALRVLWNFSVQYEESMPDRVIDAYVANLQEDILDTGVVETLASMQHDFQSDEEVRQIVKDMFNGEIRAVDTQSGDNETKCYNLYCDGNKFGAVYLTRDTTKKATFNVYGYELNLPWDLRPWVVSKEEFDFNGLYSAIEVTIPESYSLKLNGITVGSQYIVERNILLDSLKDYYDVGTALPKKVKYKYDKIIGHLEPMIYDETGSEFFVDTQKDDSQYIKGCTEAQLVRLDAFCRNFTYEYLKYISGLNKGNGYWNLAPYLLSGSDLDIRMQNNQDGLSWAHTTSFSLDGYKLNGAIELGQGYYVCDLTADTTTYTSGQGEVKNTSSLKLLVVDSGAEIRAVSLR